MAATDYYIGKDVRIGVAINAEVSGISFNGTPGSYDCMKLQKGNSCKIDHINAKTPVEETGIVSEDHETGGLLHKISLDLVMSYSKREKFFQLYNGAVAATVGGSAPYTHTLTLAKKVLNGSFFVEYAKQSGQPNQFIRDTYDNFVITGIEIKQAVEQFALLSVKGFCTGMVHSTAQSSLTSTSTTERLSWKHFSPTLNGTSTYRLGDIGVSLGASLAEGEFDHAAGTPTSQDGNWYSGNLSVGYTADVRMNDSSYALSSHPAILWDGTNEYKWDNGKAAGDNRQFVLTFGNSYIDTPNEAMGEPGRITQSLSLTAEGGSTPIIGIVFINASATV